MSASATALRHELRDLVQAHVPDGLPRRLHRRPGRPRGGAGVLPPARRARPAVHVVAGGVRRARRRRCGSRPWCARRCGPTTSRAARSTWASTGWARRSCGTAPPSSSASTCRRSRAARSSGARGSASPRPARTWRRCGPRPPATATAGASTARRSGRRTRPWRSGASCWPAPPRASKKQRGLTIFLVPMSDPAIKVRPIGCMMGPHHLNEVFFDDLRVTEADVLGTVDDGWSIVAGRAGLRARRHRPLRPLRAAAPDGARRARRPVGRPARRTARPVGPDADALPPGPAAGLPAGGAAERADR